MKPLDPRLVRGVRPARTFVVVAAVVGIATGALIIGQAGLLSALISRGFVAGAGLAQLWPLLVALAVVIGGRALLGWMADFAAHRASAAIRSHLRIQLLSRICQLGPRWSASQHSGELATLATRGVDALDPYVSQYLPQLFVAAVVPAMMTGWILLTDPAAALIVVVTVPLVPVFMILVGLRTQAQARRQWRGLARLAHHFIDVLAGLPVLAAYGRAGRQAEVIRLASDRYRSATMRTLRIAFLSALVLELIATLSVALVAVTVGLRLVQGQLDLRTALLVLILAPEVYLPLRAVGAQFHASAEGLAAADEIFTILEAKRPAGDADAEPNRSIRFERVSVNARGKPVLDRLSLTLPAGRVIGLTGPSGAGKSTVVDLLLGWLRPDDGMVRVGEESLASLDPDRWRQQIAWLPQRPRLVTGTIADNVRLGAPAATDEAVAAALRLACVDLDPSTDAGELGARLSTGQLRRVALARAFVADRPIVVLDEPTEGLDAATERRVVANLKAALAGRTVLIVSHRPAPLAICDSVVRLAEPTIVSPLPKEKPAAPATASEVAAVSTVDTQASGVRWLVAALRPRAGRLLLAVLAGAVASGAGIALMATSGRLISTAALHPPVLTLMVAIVAVRTFGLARPVFRYLERLASHDVALRLLGDLRVRIWRQLLRIGPGGLRLCRGDLLSRVVSDVDSQQDAVVRAVVPLTSAVVTGLGAAACLSPLSPLAGVVMLLFVVVAVFLVPSIAVFLGSQADRRLASARGALSAATVELVQAGADITAYGAHSDTLDRVRRLDATFTRLLGRAASVRGIGALLSILTTGAAVIASAVVGITALRGGHLNGVDLAVLVLTPLAAAEMFAGLPAAAQHLAAALPAARRLAELVARPSAAAEPSTPALLPAADTMSAQHLALRWPRQSADAVRDLSLQVRPGQVTALAGPSGSGKSTVVAALMRFLDPAAGAVHLGDTDTRRLAGNDVRSRIAWCGPDSHLFDNTVRANLLLARPDATDDELRTALASVRLLDWVDSLPSGLDTPVGDGGAAISGGQRQRLGLARVFLADRDIMLLDEPVAHLDPATADAVMDDIFANAAGKSVLLVTHRQRDLAAADTVASLH
ncbi:thiol reductant ABC exporter subunit CydD [Fodinicola acaciae]|uniref:thiol reductant ABC exporter subunit CydD n=1 Tax=Fodinicola acaciae TaxID=2681555 RepID=UPI0013D00D78|nr:thiol reductant ABC exporter subunit CydD [Fodinicola acaciae]